MSQFVNVKKINNKEKIMPKVNGKHYPYTDAGKKAASAAKKAKGLKGFKDAMEKQRYKGKK
tara:strand:- start:1286 stop:1468 length:183 start_codon:yes stop_codon:yes gene_type:complete